MKLPYAEEGLVLGPGEALVVRFAEGTAQQMARAKEMLAAQLPGVRVVVVVADQLAALPADAVAEDEEHIRTAMLAAEANPGLVGRADGA